jgi:Pyocin activator protein PrtN
MTATTIFLLMAQYNGKPIIPVDTVRADFFAHLSLDKFLRKTATGEIRLPIVRIEASQKSERGVHLSDLAAYIDERRKAAVKELTQLSS